MIPLRLVADDECFSWGRFMSDPWRAWAGNAQHFATARGRPAIHAWDLRYPIAPAAGPVVIDLPVLATPHENLYDVRITLGTVQAEFRLALDLRWTVSSLDAVGGGHASTLQPAGTVPLRPDGAGADARLAGRYGEPMPSVGEINDLAAVVFRHRSGWLRHRTADNLDVLRTLRLTFTWNTSPGFLVFLQGVTAVGLEERELA